MPAQPLSSVKPDANVRFGTNTFKRYPHFAPPIANVINLASIAEHKWAAIFAHALKSDLEAAVAVFRSLSGSATRLAVVQATARLRLSPDEFEIMGHVYSVTRLARNLRNDFAHHLWGDSPEIPDALLLIDPAYYPPLDATAGVAQGEANPDKSKMYVYKHQDFEDAVCEAHTALLTVVDFVGSLIAEDKNVRDLMRQRLLARPKIAEALRSAQNRKQRQPPE